MAILNKLYYGDNLNVLRKYIKEDSIDLCYIDPPFKSDRTYNQIYNNIGKEDRAQAQAFVDTWKWDELAIEGFDEINENYNGVFTHQSIELINALSKILTKGPMLSYLVSMTLRTAEIYRVLKPTGSFFLHCDPTASHYLKLVLDAIFCGGRRKGDFKNEIVWCYTSPSKVASYFPRKHDVIFFYTKSNPTKMNFDEVRVPYSKESLSRAGRNVIKKGGTIYDHVELNEKGKIPEDWWADIVPASRKPGERLGYPTQKPEQLLERIIKACSKEGDVILDAYCGCGTSVSVAQKLNRNWIGIDITYNSIALILKRLEDSFGKNVVDKIELNGLPKDMNSAIALANKKDDRTRKEFEKWAVLTYSDNRAMINEKKGGDGGIDGIALMLDRNEKSDTEHNKILFSVKSNKTLSPSVIRDLNGTMEREGAAMGYLITLYPMPNLVKESKQYGVYYNSLLAKNFPKIEVISVEEILNGKRMSIPASHKVSVVKEAEENYGDIQPTLDL